MGRWSSIAEPRYRCGRTRGIFTEHAMYETHQMRRCNINGVIIELIRVCFFVLLGIGAGALWGIDHIEYLPL